MPYSITKLFDVLKGGFCVLTSFANLIQPSLLWTCQL